MVDQRSKQPVHAIEPAQSAIWYGENGARYRRAEPRVGRCIEVDFEDGLAFLEPHETIRKAKVDLQIQFVSAACNSNH